MNIELLTKVMNIELLTKVRDAIAAEPDRFYMGAWWSTGHDADEVDLAPVDGFALFAMHGCGTAGCTAGWANFLSGTYDPKERDDLGYHTIESQAAKALGLTTAQAARLFCSNGFVTDLYDPAARSIDDVTAADAVRVLSGIIDGTIDL